MVAEQGLVLPANYDLVLFLEERQVSGGYNWLYYFADNVTRSLFWIQECHPNDELEIGEITAFKTAYDVSESFMNLSSSSYLICRLYRI